MSSLNQVANILSLVGTKDCDTYGDLLKNNSSILSIVFKFDY